MSIKRTQWACRKWNQSVVLNMPNNPYGELWMFTLKVSGNTIGYLTFRFV